MKAPGRMLREVLNHLFMKPATVQYPFVKADMPDKFRGQILFDPENCNGCRACMRDCPSNAIKINKVANGKFEATFQLDRCLYCAQCADSCQKHCLRVSKHYELAALNRNELKVTFHVKPEDEAKIRPEAAKPPAQGK